MDLLDLVQWPAMVVTVLATWVMASKRERRRNEAFWIFLLSNALWLVWGIYSGSPALVALQLCLAAMNIRGASRTQDS